VSARLTEGAPNEPNPHDDELRASGAPAVTLTRATSPPSVGEDSAAA